MTLDTIGWSHRLGGLWLMVYVITYQGDNMNLYNISWSHKLGGP